MIEIRVDGRDRPITPDGPQTPDRTRAVAEAIGQGLRLLNYATMPGRGGLRYPSDVYGVLGTLASAVALLPQAAQQMHAFIAAEVHAGYARENPGYGDHQGDAEAACLALEAAVQQIGTQAHTLAGALGHGQAATRGLESTRDHPDD